MLNKLSKEELELLSYAKIAEMYLKENKKTMSTADLFREVCRLLGLDDNEYQERIADFFESLTTSKDFILLSDGNWDLRANHSVKIDMIFMVTAMRKMMLKRKIMITMIYQKKIIMKMIIMKMQKLILSMMIILI